MGGGVESDLMTPVDSPGAPLDFRCRWNGQELMDDPACDEAMLLRTVDQFESINRLVSRYRSILSRLVLDDMKREPDRIYHLIDLGAGGCDIPVWLLRESARRGLRLRVTAIDGDARIAKHALLRHGQVQGLSIHTADVSAMDQFGPVDYIFTNHVLHHLPEEVIPGLIQTMRRIAGRRWIISDLRRSRWAYLGFQFLGRFYRESYAFEDGKRSIRRGFIPEDFRRYADASGVTSPVEIFCASPGRIVMVGGRT